MASSFHFKSAESVHNWTVTIQKSTGKYVLTHYEPCYCKDPGAKSGRTAVAGRLTTSATFVKREAVLVRAKKDGAGIWFGRDEDGKIYKMLIGNKYSNTSFKVQTVGAIDAILGELDS